MSNICNYTCHTCPHIDSCEANGDASYMRYLHKQEEAAMPTRIFTKEELADQDDLPF